MNLLMFNCNRSKSLFLDLAFIEYLRVLQIERT